MIVERIHKCYTCDEKFYHKEHNMFCGKCNSKNCSDCLLHKMEDGNISKLAFCEKCLS